MRLLLTGTRATSGRSWRPCSRTPGTRSSAWIPTSSRPVRSARSRGRSPSFAGTSATSAGRTCEGFDAVVHLAALSNDPLGDLNPELTYDINHHATVRLARLAKEAGVPGSSSPPPAATTARPGEAMVDRGIGPQPGDALRGLEGPRGSRSSRRWRIPLLPHLPAEHDGLRGLAAAAVRHRSQQPRRLGRDDGADPPEERRDAVAAHRPRRRHLAGLSRGPRGAPGAGSQRGLQRRPDRRELPDPGARRDRPGRRSRDAGSSSPAGAGPDARSYRVDFGKIARLLPAFRPALAGPGGGRRALRRIPGEPPPAGGFRGSEVPAGSTTSGS